MKYNHEDTLRLDRRTIVKDMLSYTDEFSEAHLLNLPKELLQALYRATLQQSLVITPQEKQRKAYYGFIDSEISSIVDRLTHTKLRQITKTRCRYHWDTQEWREYPPTHPLNWYL